MIEARPKQEERMEVRLFAAAKQYSTDDDSAGSSEEMDSPRSSLKKVAYVHSQILRIREEDSHLGEISFGAKEKVDVVLLARPGLPCSPLRNTVNALD